MKCLKSIILRGSCISLTLLSPRSSGNSSTYNFGSTTSFFFDLFESTDLSNAIDFEFALLIADLSADFSGDFSGDLSSTSSSETASNSGN